MTTDRRARDGEAHLRALFDSIDQGFCILEVILDGGGRPSDYRFLEANPAFERHTGLIDAVGRTAREMVPGLEDRWVQIYGRVALTGEPTRFVEGSEAMGRWFDVHASRLGGDGSLRVALVFNDVTARRRAEAEQARLQQEIEAERARLADVFQRAPSVMAVLRGPDHVFERVNDRYAELIGRRDVIGKPVREALPEVAGQGFFERLDHVYRTGEPFVGADVRVLLQRRPDAPVEERYLDFVYQALFDAGGTVTGVLTQGVDLTERHRAVQDGLRTASTLAEVTAESVRRRRLYETILDNTPDLIYVFDLQHRFAYANAGLLRMWGLTWEQAIGKTCLEIGYEPWHAEMHDREIEQVVATRRPIRGEVPFRGTFGRRIYDYIFVPVLGENGAVEAVAGTTRDVTDMRAAFDALKDADRRKDEFLATLAHELRNPLAPIRTGLEVLKVAPSGASSARARDMMERQLRHMVRLVDDLLDVSRISRGKVELQRERIDLRTVVDNAIETSLPLITAGGHDLAVELPDRPIWLEADLIRLAQVLGNVLTNAAKYTPSGGRIRLSARLDGGEVVICIEDTGVGIPAEMLEHVFEMFSQVNKTLDRAQGGLGIGLALVKRLVEMHGGTIGAASAGLGRGSTFTIRLPASSGADAAVGAVGASVARAPGRRILVVDDNVDAAECLAMLLELSGHEAKVAHDGVRALALAREYRPSVVFLDIGLPGMDGYEVARQMRGEGGVPDAALIALTGWGSDSDRERSRQAGFHAHLVKPIDNAEVVAVMSRLTRGAV